MDSFASRSPLFNWHTAGPSVSSAGDSRHRRTALAGRVGLGGDGGGREVFRKSGKRPLESLAPPIVKPAGNGLAGTVVP
ncbi:MAG: hypothetical protein ACI855_000947 [Myxococcota bacterium]|jgi:hypothetical protein